MVRTGDTIAAISSAVGASARMIVRVSGPDAVRIAITLCPDAECSVRYQASQPAMLAEALAILATTRTRSLRT